MGAVYQFKRETSLGKLNRRIRRQEIKSDGERVRIIVDKVVALFVACVESVMDDLTVDETDDEAVFQPDYKAMGEAISKRKE